MTYDKAVDSALRNLKYSDFFDKKDQLINNVKEAILNFFMGLLKKLRLPDIKFRGEPLAYSTTLLVIAAVVVLIILLAVAIILVRRNAKRKRRLPPGMNEIFQMLDDKRLSANDLMNQSDGLARQEEYREAVRYRYIALLWLMNERQLLNIRQSQTNNQIIEDLNRKRPDLLPDFRYIVDLFNFSWFGMKKISVSHYDEFRACYDGLLTEAEK